MNENDFFQFVKEQSGTNDTVINMDTRLEDDLGVYGDDAVDFMLVYGKHYNVDVSRFMAADYFNGEGLVIFSHLTNKLFGIKEKRKIFTVGHLYKGIQAGRLDDEIING